MLTRYPNWASRLSDFLVTSSSTPFAWGVSDCCLFAADAVRAMTGHDLASDFRGRYQTLAEAQQLRLEYCGSKSLSKFIDQVLEPLQAVKPCFAQRGDIALVRKSRGMYSVGVIDLAGHPALMSKRGLVRLSVSFCVKAWHI